MSDLTQLLKKLDIDDSPSTYQHIENVSVASLPESLKPYLVSILKQDKYELAYSTLQKYSLDSDKLKLYVEKAYVFYKLNKKQEFQNLLNDINITELTDFEVRGLDHIKAQFYYKLGKFDESFAIYQCLASSANNSDDILELEINRECTNQLYPVDEVNLKNVDSYDLALNRSVVATNTGNHSLARKYAQLAIDLSQDPEEFSMAEFQLAYLTCDNKKKEKMLKTIMQREDNQLLHSMVKNNLQAMESSGVSTVLTNFPLVLNKIDPKTVNILKSESRYSSKQSDLISSNILLLRLFSNSSIQDTNGSVFQYALAKYKSLVSDIVMDPYTTQAKKLYHYFMKSLEKYSEYNIKHVAVLLLSVQLQIQTKQYENAISLLTGYITKFEKSIEWNVLSTLNITLLKLYKLINRKNNRVGLLLKIVSSFETESSKIDARDKNAIEFWEFIAHEFLELGKIQKYQLISSKLNTVNHKNTNFTKFHSTCDVLKLIEVGIKPFTSKLAQPKVVKVVKKKTKKISKKSYNKTPRKLPKDYDPSRVPDPERWLPKKDRTSTMMKKPARKQRKLIAEGKSTQGGGLNNKKLARKLDISKRNTKPSKKSTPTSKKTIRK